MSYSRWSAPKWHAFWANRDEKTENRETALFEICGVASFTAAELRSGIEKCLDRARQAVTPNASEAELEKLRGYMHKFLTDVDREYPE